MKILMASTEMEPLARTGGLGDVVEALSAELLRQGHEISVVLPLYRKIRENPALKIRSTGVEVTVGIGSKRAGAAIFECQASNGVQVFLVGRDEYFDRTGLYGTDGRNYDDNCERFIFFARAVMELARHMDPVPDVLHAHDWQTALLPVFVKDAGLPFGTVLTVHNLAYQGSFLGHDFSLTNLPGHYYGSVEFHGRMNFLKGGIVCADAVTTVSERYARDIQAPEYGCGLDGVLRANANKLVGILNGADYSIWSPEVDSLIPANYGPQSLGGKRICRDALLQELELQPEPRGPVFSIVTRLADQKGIDMLVPLMDRLLADDVRLIVLGEGDPAYERDLLVAARKYQGKVIFRRGFDDRLAHRIEAAADITLMPSHFEPCGLTAMYSLKYGTIPVARVSGGLHQIIQDYDPTTGTGNGFVFFDDKVEAFWDAIGRSKKLFTERESWTALMLRAMAADFSWPVAATRYERVYESTLHHVPAAKV